MTRGRGEEADEYSSHNVDFAAYFDITVKNIFPSEAEYLTKCRNSYRAHSKNNCHLKPAIYYWILSSFSSKVRSSNFLLFASHTYEAS
jgi:hypothetical protein